MKKVFASFSIVALSLVFVACGGTKEQTAGKDNSWQKVEDAKKANSCHIRNVIPIILL